MTPLIVPPRSLIVLVGASGSGKTTFSRRHFLHTQVVSSDDCRGMISDDNHNYECSPDAFALVYFLTRLRLKQGRLTVVDSTAVEWRTRETLLAMAEEYEYNKIAVVFDIPRELCVERDAGRPRPVGPRVIDKQKRQLHETVQSMPAEGWDEIVSVTPDNQKYLRLAIAWPRRPLHPVLSLALRRRPRGGATCFARRRRTAIRADPCSSVVNSSFFQGL